MANEVLIVVDMQNDFCEGGALAVPGANAVVPMVNRLIDRYDHVVLTQDWHPAGHSSFAASHPAAVVRRLAHDLDIVVRTDNYIRQYS